MNKMKLYGFLRVSEVEKYEALSSFGVQVDVHIKDNIAISLYVINDFCC
jgi:hypothetical protein